MSLELKLFLSPDLLGTRSHEMKINLETNSDYNRYYSPPQGGDQELLVFDFLSRQVQQVYRHLYRHVDQIQVIKNEGF